MQIILFHASKKCLTNSKDSNVLNNKLLITIQTYIEKQGVNNWQVGTRRFLFIFLYCIIFTVNVNCSLVKDY